MQYNITKQLIDFHINTSNIESSTARRFSQLIDDNAFVETGIFRMNLVDEKGVVFVFYNQLTARAVYNASSVLKNENGSYEC